jgi:predicted GIY-YIG superfamily endonuclease
MAWTYILRCSDNSFYVGSARDLDLRMDQHARGQVPGYTATRRPVELVWAFEQENIADAFARERQLKGWSRAKKEALISGNVDLLPSLSKRGSARAGPS